MTKRNIMRAFKIAEISGVDVPAQEGAKALIMKRAPKSDAVAKNAALTNAVNGHTHMIVLSYPPESYGYNGELNAGTTSWDADHCHPWVRTEDGTVVIGEAKGHTHEVATVGKTASQSAGSTGEQVETKETAMTLEEMQKQLARVTALAELNDVQKAHLQSLDAAGQEAFLAKSAAEREADVAAVAKAAAEADPVVYKTLDGIEIRKSDGGALLTLAKSNDDLRKSNAKLQEDAADAALTREVEKDYAHLPGDLDARKALIKAAKTIPDATQRDVALNALKAQSIALAKATETLGHGGAAPEVTDAEKSLDDLAKAYQKEHSVSFAKAMDAVLQTPKGAELYDRATGN